MMPSRGMGDINSSKMPKARTITRKDDPNKVKVFKAGGKSRVNEAGNYTKPGLRKSIFERIKAGGKGGNPGQWSARKAQMLAQQHRIEHRNPCDCGGRGQIDFELFEKEAAKD
jgi:hypothetical protein